MGNGILAFGTHFGKGETGFLHLEDRVVAKTVLSTELGYHLALYDSLKEMLLKRIFCVVGYTCEFMDM